MKPLAEIGKLSEALENSDFDAELIRFFSKENTLTNLMSTVVLSLTIWANAELVPTWTWMPGLAAVYVITAIRAILYEQYRRKPQWKTPAQWGRIYTAGAGSNGICWGIISVAMCAHLPVENQLFVAAVVGVSASFAAGKGFAFTPPSTVYIVGSVAPLTLWLYAQGERLHLMLAVLLTIFIPMVLVEMRYRHRTFTESLRLQLKNTFLAHELARQKEVAEAAARAKSRFLAAASHDLRQPLQALTFYQELALPEMTLTPKGQDFYARQQQATETVSNLLDSLLDISRLDAGTTQPRPEDFAVAELFDQMQAEFAPEAQQKGLELRLAGCSAVVYSDPTLLDQLLRNLVSNALRYTPSGKILIGCRRRNGAISLEVWDTGIGIPADQHEAIFGEFYQVQNRERDRQKGLGLGLAIVARIARLLDTQVTVRSQPGKGSCFAVSLPVSPVQQAVSPAQKSGRAVDLRGRVVIVVENEEIIRHSLRTLLENWGCRVISGPSSQAIVEQLSGPKQTVDIVISDLNLSEDETGIDVMHKLRQRLGNEFKAMLITGDTSPLAMHSARPEMPVLHKPLSPQRLHETMSALLDDRVSASTR
jgi:signal transduction histidine kinase